MGDGHGPDAPVRFDRAAVDRVARACGQAAFAVDGAMLVRGALQVALDQVSSGAFARLLAANSSAAAGEATRLRNALARVRSAVDAFADAVEREDRRRGELRAWRERRDRQAALADAIQPSLHPGEPIAPVPAEPAPPGPPPEPVFTVSFTLPPERERPVPPMPGSTSGGPTSVGSAGGGSAGGGPVSGDPELLAGFSAALASAGLERAHVPLRNALEDLAGGDWGRLAAGDVVAGVEAWASAHAADSVWARLLGAALAVAGGSGDAALLAPLLAGLTESASRDAAGGAVLHLLTTMAPEDVREVFLARPGLLRAFQEHPPPFEQVSTWWTGLDNETKREIAHGFPAAIGNLPGVPYADRDDANRRVLREALALWEGIAANGTLSAGDLRASARRHSNEFKVLGVDLAALGGKDDVADVLSHLRGLEHALQPSQGGLPRQLVQFFPGEPRPLASIATGNLDTADRVTTVTPGMNSSLADSKRLTDDADNLTELSQVMHEQSDGTDSFASVAFFNDDAPTLFPDPTEVTQMAHARTGAERYAGFLSELKAGKDLGPNAEKLVAVGHSYGTTMNAVALAEEEVGGFVALASAGIDGERIPDDTIQPGPMLEMERQTARLRVAAEDRFTTRSSSDVWAPLGIVGSWAAGGPLSVDGDQRVEPAAALSADEFTVLPSGDLRVPAGYESLTESGDGRLSAPTGHDLGATHPGDVGYLTPGSTTQWNAAAVIAGREDMVSR